MRAYLQEHEQFTSGYTTEENVSQSHSTYHLPVNLQGGVGPKSVV